MAREASITYEQVATIADELKVKELKPTSRAVREALGTGSMATVCKLLEQWKSGQTKPNQVSDDSIDQSVARALNAHIAARIQAATNEATARLADIQTELASVIQENERQSSELGDQEIQLAHLKDECANLTGQTQQLSAELSRVTAELETERKAAEQARIQQAKAELRLEAVPRIEAEIERANIELAVERKTSASAREEAAELRGRLSELQAKK